MKLLTFGRTITGILSGLCLLMASCADESPWGSQDGADGRINLNLVADSSVSDGTRADDTTSPLVPNTAEFSITLKSTDGAYSNTWNSLSAFNKEDGFPMGSYLISASFGNMDQEGFKNPYFYGESKVNVAVGQSSDATIVATLANAMVSLRYTDEFSDFFPGGFSGIVQTEGHDPIPFVQSETRPAYISVGNVDLKLSLTDESGNTVVVNPASFVAEPKKHYIVKFGVDGNTDVGRGILTVEWSEEVISETHKIYLTEELFTSPDPEITVAGYDTAGVNIMESLEYEDLNPEFHVFAFGGLAKASLHLGVPENSSIPESIRNIDLVSADIVSQTTLKSLGIDCAGFNDGKSEMAVINFKEFIKNLAPGYYTVSLDVKDSLGREFAMEDAAVLKINVEGLQYEFVGCSEPDFMSNEIVVTVATNSESAKDQFKFRSYISGIVGQEFEDVTATLLEQPQEATKETSLPYKYSYKLTTGAIDDWKWKVRTNIGQKVAHEVDVKVNMPEFTIETDAFAKWMRFRLKEDTDEKIVNWLTTIGKITDGNNDITSLVKFNSETKLFEISEGIVPGQTYNYSFYLGKTLVYERYKNNLTFKAEEAVEVPNGDFETQGQLYSGTLNQGGRWTATLLPVYRQNTATYSFNDPAGWATTNIKTMNGKTNLTTNDNTWFVQPSVFNSNLSYISNNVGNGAGGAGSETPASFSGFYSHSGNIAMVIRNVAWDSNYSSIADDMKTTTSGGYYNRNDPTLAFKSVGKMFLGTYTFSSGIEEYKLGIPFNSRPSLLKGWYIYTPDKNDKADKGKVTVLVYNNEEIIASGTTDLEECINYLEFSIPLTYKDSDFGKNANKISILVEASQYGSLDMNDETAKINVSIYNSRYESYKHGATLIVDDFEFEYKKF